MLSRSASMELELPLEWPECRNVVEDWAQGSAMCRSCGVVVLKSLQDISPKWRTFASEVGDDPNRVDSLVNPAVESEPDSDISAQGPWAREAAALWV